MIPGIISSQASSGAADRVEGEIIFADFTTGTYRLNGFPSTPEAIFEGIQTGMIAPDVGLSIEFDDPGSLPYATEEAQALIVAAMQSGVTLDVEVFSSPRMDFSNGTVMMLTETGTVNDDSEQIAVYQSNVGSTGAYDFFSLNLNLSRSDGNSTIHRAAVTVNRDIGGGDFSHEASANGSAIESDVTDYSIINRFSPQRIKFFHEDVNFVDDNAQVHAQTVRLIRIVEALDPSELPALSVPSTLGQVEPGIPAGASVALLLHFDGDQDDTETGDDSTFDRTVTFNGAGFIDETESKFGGSSYRQDATNQSLTIANDAMFEIGDGAFAFDFWFQIDEGVTALRSIAAMSNQIINRSWELNISQTALTWTISEDGSAFIPQRFEIAIDAAEGSWHHIAVSRNTSGRLRIHFNGALVAALQYGLDANESGEALTIGNGSLAGFEGWIDEFRFVAGENPFDVEANINVPTGPYPNPLA